jgi:hypothetical protein
MALSEAMGKQLVAELESEEITAVTRKLYAADFERFRQFCKKISSTHCRLSRKPSQNLCCRCR